MIVIDVHEPIEIVEKLKDMDVLVNVRKLSVGDYVIGKIGIERKSFHDFFRSIIDKRIFSQASRLKEAYEKPIIILEGDYEEALNNVTNPNTLLGEIVSIIIDNDISIIYSRNKRDTATILYLIWSRTRHKKKNIILRYKPHILSMKDRLIFITEGFPGIGYKLADNILFHFGTLRNLALANMSELCNINGIGINKAETIYKILNTDYRKLKKRLGAEE